MSERKSKSFSVVRVATKNMIVDSFQGIRNIFGLRLRGYERMIKEHLDAAMNEAQITYPNIIWYRVSVNPLAKGSVMITVYGEHYE